MSEYNNFAVIDIGTNAIKCKIYNNGRYITPKNEALQKSSANQLNEDEVVSMILKYVDLIEKYGISKEKLYICATEAFRKTPNRESISKRILEEIGRKVHVMSPKREAYLSVIGGLKTIPPHRNKNKDIVSSAKNALYIESGGGSTEVSLVNLASQPPSIVSTVSLPVGSKTCNHDEKIFDEKITEFMQQISKEKYLVKEPLVCVVNANAISRIISHQYNAPKFDAYATMAKQQRMSFRNLQAKLTEILTDSENKNKIVQDYNLDKSRVDGFVEHCQIISGIFEKLHAHKLSNKLNYVPVITTIGGLKEGLADVILHSDERDITDFEQTLLKIDETVETKHNVTDAERNPDTTQDKIQTLKRKLNSDKTWISEIENFYTASKHEYHISKTRYSILVEDKFKQKVNYQSRDKITISANANTPDNTFYEDIVANAKKLGQDNILLKDTVNLDTKLRFYSASLKLGMKIIGFEFDKAMLEKVTPETKKIVETSIAQNSQEKSLPNLTNKGIEVRN